MQPSCIISGARQDVPGRRFHPFLEEGPARSVVEAVFSFANSFICQRYKLPKSGTEIEVDIEVHWNEKDKLLKLSIPIAGSDCKYLGQVAYGVQKLPDNGNEAVSQKWLSRDTDNFHLTSGIVNTDQYRKRCMLQTVGFYVY